MDLGRRANFTSSQVYKLIKKGRGGAEFSASGMTYIKEKALETKLGRGLSTDAYSQAISWGFLMEAYVYNHILPLNYRHVKNRRFHKEISNWCGIPDYEIPDIFISEIKCYQLKRFAEYSLALEKRDIELLRDSFPEEYWQVISNASINNVSHVEMLSFCPNNKQLDEVRHLITETDFLEKNNFQPWQYRYIEEKKNWRLPCLPETSEIKPLTRFKFEVPTEDLKFLESRIRLANDVLGQTLQEL